MDPRGPDPPRLRAPEGALEELQGHAGAAFPRLLNARRHTGAQLAARRDALGDLDCPDGISIVLFGSWARQELTEASDDDWAVLVEQPELLDAAGRVKRAAESVFGQGDKKPGAQATFGAVFTCEELIGQVGLEDDVNALLTRRMLLLLESVAVIGAKAHSRCRERVLSTYLERGAKDNRPPRFLLNDVVRYWRTMCVDFEGKSWRHPGPKWVTRNAKLRTSRKLLFAAGLVPLLACGGVRRADQFAFLAQQFAAVPTDRLARAFLDFDDGALADSGARGLMAYDRFVDLLADHDTRRDLLNLTAQTRDESPLWREIETLGDELQQSLLALLFGRSLSTLTRQFAIF